MSCYYVNKVLLLLGFVPEYSLLSVLKVCHLLYFKCAVKDYDWQLYKDRIYKQI